MASKKTTSDPAPIAGLDPLAILTIETLLSRVAIRFANAQHVRGPVDLQALWCDAVKARLSAAASVSSGGNVTEIIAKDAADIADRVVAAFVERAENLAAMTAQLPYFDSTEEAEESDGVEGE